MQNTVIQHNALSLSGNVYMNSTTKFVKGAAINPEALEKNRNQTIISTLASALSSDKPHKMQHSPLSNLIAVSSPTKFAGTGTALQPEEEEEKHMEEVELMAINLSASIFMNSTTKFVKGFADLANVNTNASPLKKGPQPKRDRKSLSKAKDQESRSSSPPTFIKQRTPEKTGLDLAATNYMNSTTKYVHPSDETHIIPAKSIVEKLVRAPRSPSNEKPQSNLNRNRLATQLPSNVEKSRSKSDSGSKLQRRKDRIKDLKFLQQQNEESSVTIKDRPLPRNVEPNSKRNDPKAQVEKAAKPLKTEIAHQLKRNDLENSLLPESKSNRISRNSVTEVKSADSKRTELKEETARPFARQPQNARPQLLTTQKTQQQKETLEKAAENVTSILQHPFESEKAPLKKEVVKTAATLPSGQLPLQTPVKTQIVKAEPLKKSQKQEPVHNRPPLKPKVPQPISTIKEQRIPQAQIPKTSTNSKKILYHGSVREEESVHVDQIPSQVVYAANKPNQYSRLTKNESINVIGKELAKVNSAHLFKLEEKSEETVVIPKRPIARKQEKIEQAHQQIEDKPVSSPALLEEKRMPQRSQYQPLNRKNVKSEPTEEISSKTSIESATLPYNNKRIENISLTQKVASPTKLQEHALIKKQSNRSISNEQTKPTKETPSLKQVYALVQATTRLYASILDKSWISIKEKSKSSRDHSKQAKILSLEAANTHQNLYLTNLRTFFDQLKKLSLTNPSNKKSNLVNPSKEVVSSIIYRCILSKEREYFQFIKWASPLSPSIVSKPSSKSREREVNDSKQYQISQLIKIIHNYNLSKIRSSFNKLILESVLQKKKVPQKTPLTQVRSPPKTSKPPRDYESQKSILSQSKSSLQALINNLESRLAEKKRYSDFEKSKLIKKQDDLTKKHKVQDSEVLQKRKRNRELKAQLDLLGQDQELDISLPQYEPLVGILTEIYSGIFGSNEEVVNVQALTEKYSLIKQDSNPLLKQWQALMLNAKLKGEISKWQGEGCLVQAQQKVSLEKDLISKVLRSYVRERYLWQWLKITADRL